MLKSSEEYLHLLPNECRNCPFVVQLLYALSTDDLNKLAAIMNECKSCNVVEDRNKFSPRSVDTVPGKCGNKGECHELET